MYNPEEQSFWCSSWPYEKHTWVLRWILYKYIVVVKREKEMETMQELI